MKWIERVKEHYKQAAKQHRKAKKAYLKAKAKGVKSSRMIQLWKEWQQAKYQKKAGKEMVKWLMDEVIAKKNKTKSSKPSKSKLKAIKKRKNSSRPKSEFQVIGESEVPAKLSRQSTPPVPEKQTTPPTPVPSNGLSASKTSLPKHQSVNRPDNFKRIEGIGPKIQHLLHEAGIYTFQELAATRVAKLRKILAEAGPRFRMHNPGSWSRQARLAAQEKWQELKTLQEKLKNGK